MARRIAGPAGQNFLLAGLSEADRDLVMRRTRPVDLPRSMVLDPAGERIGTVFFPIEGVGSVIARGQGTRQIEAGLFGPDGMSGASILLGADRSPNETLIQVAGHGLAIEAEDFRAALAASQTLRDRLLLFPHAMYVQTSQTALSNGQAKLEERLARWLLMCHDRLAGDELDLTHQFLSIMLGVRRAGVTVGTHILEGKGLIRAARGRITILDRPGLEEEARSSYGVPEAEYMRLLGGWTDAA